MLSDLTFEVLAVQIGLNGEDGSAWGGRGISRGGKKGFQFCFGQVRLWKKDYDHSVIGSQWPDWVRTRS